MLLVHKIQNIFAKCKMSLNIKTLHAALAEVPVGVDNAFNVSLPCTNANSEPQVSDFRFDYLCLIEWFSHVNNKKEKEDKKVKSDSEPAKPSVLRRSARLRS